jgi:phosphodiesterase/alkaline phosphatase D-like protein
LLFSTYLFAQTLPFDVTLKPFYHGMASSDPLADRVIIWTRVKPEQDQTINGSYIMATDTVLKNVVKTGTFSTDNSKDYTVKVDVTGLTANTTYYYAFTALGKRSMIGKVVKILTPMQKQTAGIYDLSDYFVGDLNTGVYFLNIKTDESNVARKIVIQK